MDAATQVNIVFGGKQVSMPTDTAKRYGDGSTFYLTGTSGKLYVVTEKVVSKITDDDRIKIDGTDQKVIDVFNKAVKEAKTLETKTFKWRFHNKILPLVDLTAGIRNFITAIRPMLDYTACPAIFRVFDGAMVMIYGAYVLHEATGKFSNAWDRSSIDWESLNQFLQTGNLSDIEAWKTALAQCFKSTKFGELFDAGLDAVCGAFLMSIGLSMVALSNALVKTVKFAFIPLMQVLLWMYIGSLVVSIIALYKSITRSYNLWIHHSELKELLETGNFKVALEFLADKVDPNERDGLSKIELLESAERELNNLIGSGELKEKVRTRIVDLKNRLEGADGTEKLAVEAETIALIQEILEDNVKQRTVHAVKILLALWGIAYMLVGIITTGGLANIALNALAMAVAFAVLNCSAWFLVDNEPIANMIGNGGVWLNQRYDELLIKRTLSIALFSGLVNIGNALHMNVEYLEGRLKEKEAVMERLREVQERLDLLRGKQGKVHRSKPVFLKGSEFSYNASEAGLKPYVGDDKTKQQLLDDTRRDLDGGWTLIVDGKTRFAPSMGAATIAGIVDEIEEEFQQILTTENADVKANAIAVKALGAVAQANFAPPTQALINQFGLQVSNHQSTEKFFAYINTKGDAFEVTIKGGLHLYERTNRMDQLKLAEVQSEVKMHIPKDGTEATTTWSYRLTKVNHLAFSILSYQHLIDNGVSFLMPPVPEAEEYFVN